MATNSQRPKGRENTISFLNAAIEAASCTEKALEITPAKAVLAAVGVLLTMIKESMINKMDYVELGFLCSDICRALDRGMNGKKLDLSQSVCDAITQLTTTVAEIQNRVTEKSGRKMIPRLFHARNDKETIANWNSQLQRILLVFNTELGLTTHTMVADIYQKMLKTGEDTDRSAQNSVSGESPLPPPRIFFGRDELIEKIVDLAEHLTPIALVGAGGIGKTSVALTVLHDDRIKRQFGVNRRFIPCDKFPASLVHFLRHLSKAVGAGVENPEDLTSLRSFLSESKDMFIVLDNAESILDPHVASAKEIYAAVEELSRLGNICLCITSRIYNVPPDCKWLAIPVLSIEAACDTFYRIYQHGERSDLINNILTQLDFHPLSIKLLATVAHHNGWGVDRLASEWNKHRTDMLQTDQGKGLATTIGLSLSSPMFQELGPDARDLLGVVAFFPQGVYESNIDWLFPTIAGRENIFDKFCVLSLAYRNDGFITMLAPIRDHLSPKDPASSPLLCSTKDRYFTKLSIRIEPGKPGFEEARWVVSEDGNVEHLLDVFATIDVASDSVWGVCGHFMEHLYWHKPRLVMLGPKIEALADDHPSKLECLFQLSQLFQVVGNQAARKRLITHALKLSRERGDDLQIARALEKLSDVHNRMYLFKEGIEMMKEASEIFRRLGYTAEQAMCLISLAQSLREEKQLDDAEEAASYALDLLLEQGKQFQVCRCHRVLGTIYRSKGEVKKAIHHLEAALGIATAFNWLNLLFWIRYSMAQLSSDEGMFDDAHAHIEQAKLHAINDNDTFTLACAMFLQASFWHTQHRFEEAKSEALGAVEMFEKLGAADNARCTRRLLQQIDESAAEPWFIRFGMQVANTYFLHPASRWVR